MATTPASNSTAVLGIDTLLSGFTILSENIDEAETVLPIPDQKGATVDELPVDVRKDLEIQFYGAGTLSEVGSKVFSYAGETWKVERIRKAGMYNDFQKYTLTAHRFTNFPAAGA